MMNSQYTGKKALVTGAAGGICRAIVQALHKEGATVYALDFNKELLDDLASQNPGIQPVVVDLTDWSATESAVKALGRIDLLVNGAGIAYKEHFMDIDPGKLDKALSVNVKSIMIVSKVVCARLIEEGKPGSIVNFSSDASITAVNETAVYSVSKAAVNQLTRVMARELGPSKIRVNAVLPTVVNAGMGKELVKHQAWADEIKALIPLGRFAEVEDVVNAVLFLLSDKASMINGILMPVDGGILTA